MIKDLTITNHLIADEARRRGIKVSQTLRGKPIILNYKGHEEIFRTQFLSQTSMAAYTICLDKALTKKILSEKGISTLNGDCFTKESFAEALKFANKIKWPVVVKPKQAIGGSNVYLNIENEREFKKVWSKITRRFNFIIVEKMFIGEEFRILATDKKVLGVTHRVPANVEGDGIHTIKELIDIKNGTPKTSADYIKKHNLQGVGIAIDDIVRANLAKSHLSLRYRPKEGEKVFLRKNSNITTGGDSIDFTDNVNSSVKEIALKVIKSIPGLFYGGVDLITKDATKNQTATDYAILEVNWNPGLALHHFPHKGRPRNVAKEIIDIAFPETKGLITK